MDIIIKDLTEDQAETVKAFAHAVKTHSINEVEYLDNFAKNFLKKKSPSFDFTGSYRIKLQPSYLDLHKASGLKVGDKVKVLRKANDGEEGWEEGWAINMDLCIGSIYEITADYGEEGFLLKDSGKAWAYSFPYYVLEKIEEEWIVKYSYDDLGRKNPRWIVGPKTYKSRREAEEDNAGLGIQFKACQIK